MKKIKFIICLIVFIQLSCTDRNDDDIYYDFLLKNETNKNIIITTYHRYHDNDLQRTITLSSGESLSESLQSTSSGPDYVFEDFLKGDSIIINYQNERKEIFSCRNQETDVNCSESRNILRNAERISNGNNRILSKYIIFQTDYDNAND